ncbi:MAG: DUF1269 domain-containing protein [Chloracidobacterium sp.]|nr:DUF1269 domain-containing protein [Chloracidobacterium sp.]
MTTLSVLEFSSPDGADQALRILQRLQQQQLIKLVDAAVVTWPQGVKGPKTKQMISTVRAGALGGAFWGFLIGLIFLLPLLGLAVGAAAGAAGGALTDIGIDDNFIKQVREKVQPGTSALFLMSAHAVMDRVVAELKDLNPELITSNLSDERESRLRELFAEGQIAEAQTTA